MISRWWAAGLVGGVALGCLSNLDERKLDPRDVAGGSAGTSSAGSAGQAGTSAGAGGAGAGGAGSGGTGAGGASGGSAGKGGTAGSGVDPGGAGGDAGAGSECTEDQLACDGGCVDAMSDNGHCGICDRACGGGTTCVEGECTCAGDLTSCSDGCTDTDSSSAHCGACEAPCDPGEVCSGGACAESCSGSEVQCGNDCADTSSSEAYCGNCETACTGVEVCTSGECACPDMLSKCDDRCVDRTTDDAHCGTCDRACSGGTSCAGGECVCPQGQTDCSGTCKSLMTDGSNCGTCGTRCSDVQTCEGGECRCPDGQVAWNGECYQGSSGCNTSRSLMNGNQTIQSGGASRSFFVRAPSGYDSARPYRLVVAYHPFMTTAAQLDAGGGSSPLPYYGHLGLSQADTIFVAPQSFNAEAWPNTNNREVIFTDDLLAAVGNALCVDRSRVFATGFSAGAGMVYALACARPDVFRAVAGFSAGPFSGCSGGTTAVAYFGAHGVADATVMITSGRQIRDKFVTLNGCTAQTPSEPTSGSGTHVCTRYSGCSAGHPVEWCAFAGDHIVDPRDSGASSSWLPASSWAFITQF